MALPADQVYRSTLNSYQNIMEQFNPGLQNLVFLGTNFVRAFRMLATAANAYFVAVGKFGEQALETSTSQTLGQILLQMTDTQRQLSNDLEVIFRRFNDDLLREMDRNMQLDVEYLTESKRRFEMEHRKRTEALGGANAELQRLERMRSTQTRDMREKIYNLEANMESFLKSSYRQALAEERRRYRFLAEKHFHLSNQFLSFYSKAREVLHNKVPGWREHTKSVPSSDISGRVSPRPASMGMALHMHSTGVLYSIISSLLFTPDCRPVDCPETSKKARKLRSDLIEVYKAMPGLGGVDKNDDNISRCSNVASPQPLRRSSFEGRLSRSGSLGEKINAMNSPRVQAIVSYTAGGNQTMLSFEKGEIIAILVPEAKNGWLYGKLEGTPKAFPLRNSRSAEDLLDVKDYSLPPADYNSSTIPVPPAPPLPSSSSTRRQNPASPISSSRRNSTASLAVSENGRSRILSSTDTQPELFPRGTNPFATVKLRPTVTNDRSKPFVR
ncbi:brain-specific angiogenesis inhibitor 1-associated protein 2-like protein 2 [Carcharodon carcharias]|uniref:brain-specific angiogenesis inhibitor 1-associated protein 2-like protein 2 n=1 Tax=Carcharodon carcharias TaxID=13397 RepID=UPI001B7ED790|nr:brain-specific angiogenesis inhibitor 1-associated protein 2-like protein 2 [Carcharodon carcharias]